MTRSVLTLLTVLGMAIPAMADWPQFRGPGGQGVSEAKNVPVRWSDTENVAWKADLPGVAWSSPAVVDGRIYLTNAVQEGDDEYSLRAVCVQVSDGSTVWDREVFRQQGKVQIHNKNSHASPTPLVADGRVYVHFGPHGTACLDLAGQVQWKNDELTYSPVHGNGGSPALFEDLLIICCDGGDTQYVVGVERKTGRIRWKTPRDTEPKKGFSFSTPLIINVAGQAQAVCPASEAVFAYEPRTGEEIWRVRYPGGYSVVPRPVFAQGLVLVCTGYNRPSLLAIDPAGEGDITDTHVRWEVDRGVPHNPSVLAVGSEVYFVSDGGIASCVDATTGEVHWNERLGGKFSASPVYADGKVYFQDEQGTCTVVKAGTEFEVLAENTWAEEGARTFASFAVLDGTLFLRSETHLYRIGN
ncbi:outer membrane biogenesis protein BamB [Maioricimonas rarisocia]|uniref:Outer membrane biogenesis protein BamB n=1 Tax=Maioricimonas rarisocia TaxID=2528026 RepID=A0A517Z237_9PLAN|nr:PQQ-binding-like beta-propeller repeat protein [Maioricimonas rarisocia]QDU36542.1 outer membrane biogenesis protein BamB [Maioricimonas rarisocia]